MLGDPWFARLLAAIEADKRSDRAISLAARLGPNYVGEMRRRGKMPGADAVLRLCRVLGVSAIYIFTGARMTREEERLLQLLSAMSSRGKDQLLDLAEVLAERHQPPAEEPPGEARPVPPAEGD